jgi:hypothetical protein
MKQKQRSTETFPPMCSVVPEGQHGTAKVDHFTVNKFDSFRTSLGGSRSFVPPGRYARLLIAHQQVGITALGGAVANTSWDTIMSDTPYERRTNYAIYREARGRVLIAGYGLGMVLCSVLKKPDVREVVVVELNADVVTLVDPHIRKWVGKRDASKLRIVQANIHDAKEQLKDGTPFDCMWFDIWADVSTDLLQEMTQLTRKYRALLAPGGFVDCWDREWLRYVRDQERRAGW